MSDPKTTSGPAVAFPYTSDFVHTASTKSGLQQRWAMAEPGPEGFVIGRIVAPRSFAGFQKLVEVCLISCVLGLRCLLELTHQLLRSQLVLDRLFTSVFSPLSLEEPGDDDDSDAGLDDLSSSEYF